MQKPFAAWSGNGFDTRRPSPWSGIVMCLFALMALDCGLCKVGYGQERNYAPRGQAATALFGKVDSLHQSVKRKLKSALGVTDSDQVAASEAASQVAPSGVASPQVAPSEVAPSGVPQEWQSVAGAASGRSMFNGQAGVHQPASSQGYQSATQSATQPGMTAGQPGGVPSISHRRGVSIAARQPNEGRVVAATENGWNHGDGFRPPASAPNAMRPVEYQDAGYPQSYVRVAEQARHAVPPSSPPVDEGWPAENSVLHSQPPPVNPVRRWQGDPNGHPAQSYGDQRPLDPAQHQNYGSFSGAPAGSNGPLPRGGILGDSQLTATQHALRLIEENGDLKAKLAMLDSENKRLKDKLAQSESLLGRSTQAVEAAHEEIQALSGTNKQLQTSLSESQQKYNRYLLETDRMLQSIREELDDVLVREISAKGN